MLQVIFLFPTNIAQIIICRTSIFLLALKISNGCSFISEKYFDQLCLKFDYTDSAIHKAFGFTVPSHCKALIGTIRVEQKIVYWL